MTPVPRDPAGNFRPPQYRLESVRAADIKCGDVVSWNRYGRADACRVHCTSRLPNGRIGMLVEDARAKCWRLEVVDPDTTVNRVEVLW